MKQIIIGKEGSQPFVIQDPKVSRRHACLVIDDNTGRMQLIDNSSTNGTFIYNGQDFVRLYANEPYPVSPDTMIQLGPDTRFHIRRLLPVAKPQAQEINKAKQPAKPERADISHLRRISDKYTAQKMELESKSGMINGLRSCTLLVSVVAGGASKLVTQNMDLGPNKGVMEILIMVAIAGFLIITLLGVIGRFNRKIIEKRNDNEHDYAVKYCCPKCSLSFRGKIYENILSERRCPRCKVEYYEAKAKQ